MGARQSLVEEMLIAQGLAERDASGRLRLFTLLTAEIVAGLCREKSAWLNQAETVDYLGCSFAMFKQLARSGLLAPAEGNRCRARKGFHRKDLDAVLERAFAGAPRVDSPPPGCATLELATRKGKCSVPDVLRMIFDRTLEPVGRLTDRLELRGLLVDAGAIIAMRQAQASNGYPIMPTSRGLHMNKRTVDFLVEQGFLQKRRMKSTRSWCTAPLITVASYRAFDAVYCTLGKLRVEVVSAPRQQHAHLRRAGVQPVIEGPGLTRIYRREHLRAAGYIG